MTTTSTVAITVDMGCCRCRTKIQKILCCLQERCRFVFEKVVYEKDKVLVSGPFDAVDLCCKLRCKAGCFAMKIEIVPPQAPEEQKKKKKKKKVPPTMPPAVEEHKQPEPPKCKALFAYPCLCPYYPYPCPSPCPTCPEPPRPCPPPLPPPSPVPPPPRPAPPPQPCRAPPQPCPPPVCNKCPAWTPCQCRGYPWVVCCEDKPDPSCVVM